MKVGVFFLVLGVLPSIAQGQVRRSIFTLDPNGPEIASLRHGVQVMQRRDPSDKTSWVYQANMHGTYDQPVQSLWNQCQHASFFFFSWHRMYLYYFERILRKASGDPNLTLPYWNYTDDSNLSDPGRRQLPLAFRQPAVQCALAPLPPTPGCNPLFVSERAGPINDGTGYLPPGAVNTSAAFAYVNFDAPEGSGGASFGGPTRSNHSTCCDPGALEQTPHNVVHPAIGGLGGWMSDPNLAARDPIFLLHHANIDRLWKRWLDQGGGRQDPTGDQVWMSTVFTFYDENGQQVQKTGKDILDTLNQLGYCYDDDPGCTPGPPPPTNCFVVRLNCQHEATMTCDPTPNTLTLGARIGNTGPWSPVGYAVGTPPNPPATIIYDGVILPGPAGPRTGIQYEFLACAVPKSGPGTCTFPTQDTLVPPAGCPGGPPPGPPPTPGQCLKQGCTPRRGGGCICE